jgi:indolepyruvate ferredoxin oxidoreductase alpha subunit
MVRAQLPPYELLDVKISLGASIGMAAGVALSQLRDNTGKQVITLCGDSSFLHSGLNGLDNGTTALSGGQPHPASQADARGSLRRAVDLAELVRAASVGELHTVDLDRGDDIRAAIEAGIGFDGVSVVIARGQCPQWIMSR